MTKTTKTKNAKSGFRPRTYWEWAAENADKLAGLLPLHVCNAALATCRITLQGPKSVGEKGKNWGRWIRMRMQTLGYRPGGIETVQSAGMWQRTDSHDAANAVLACFGLSLDDVFAKYGEPGEGEKRILDLHTIVHDLAHVGATTSTAAA